VVTNGSQDGLSRAFEMLLGPEDACLVEDPTYSGEFNPSETVDFVNGRERLL